MLCVAAANKTFDGGQGRSRRLRQPDGEGLGLGLQRGIVHNFPDHAPAFRSLGIDRITEHRQRPCSGLTDQVRQEEAGTAVRDQADPDEGLYESRRTGGYNDVAGQRKTGTGAGGHAVHRADERQPGPAHPAYDLMMESIRKLLQIGRAVWAWGHIRTQFLASAKSASGSGQHHGPAGRISFGRIDRRQQSGQHIGVHGVQFGRPVQNQLVPAAMPFDQYVHPSDAGPLCQPKGSHGIDAEHAYLGREERQLFQRAA